MYRYFLNTYRNSIPTGLPARLVDPTLRTIGEQPQFLRIGEGDHPTNELLRKVYQQPSKDVVRTKVLGEIYPPTDTDPYLRRPDNIAAIRTASEQLGIPLERTGLRIATNPFRLEGEVSDVNLLAQITNRAAGNLQRSGKPVLANALTRKAKFFSQPTSYSEIAVDGTEGVEAILEAYKKAEPRRTANSQGNRPILMQADGLDPNIGIPSGSPENIPWDNIEGMRGHNAYKPADELKRPRFIDLGTGIYTRSGERINAEQKNLLDMGLADLEDRSFILRDPASVNQVPVRAMASALPPNYYSQRDRNIPATPESIPPTRMTRDINNTPIYYSELPANYYGVKRDIPDEDRAKYTLQPVKGNWATGVTVIDETKALTDEIGSIIGYRPTAEEYRKSKRLGFEVLGVGRQDTSTLNIPEKVSYSLEDGVTTKNLWGTEVEIPTGRKAINTYVEPSQTKEITVVTPVRRMSDSMSDRILADPNYLLHLKQNVEPFKSASTPQYYLDQSKDFVGPIRVAKNTTYGVTQGKTPWREYYSDPFVYEDKGLDGEVSRLVKAVNEAPAQLENALSDQALANRKVFDIEQKIAYVPSLNRIAKGSKKGDQSITASPEAIIDWVEARETIRPIVAPLQKERRMAEVEAAKAQDRIAELRAAQELMGVEYMVKPKLWGEDVLSGYQQGSRTIGGIRDSNETPINNKFTEAIDDEIKVSRIASQPTMPIEMQRKAISVKPNAVQAWREAIQQEALDNRRDYDIASLFGFSGNY